MSAPLLSLENVTTYYAQMRILEGSRCRSARASWSACWAARVRQVDDAENDPRDRAAALGTGGAGRRGHDTLAGAAADRRRDRDRAENRRLFSDMTVRENLELGAVLRDGETFKEDLERVHELFPRLYERRNQLAGTMSGGEQQMVAMGRALMSRPRLLLMDEPSMGLSPALVQQNFRIIKEIHESGVAVLMVEQNAMMALSIADRGYVLSTGEIVLEGPASELLRSEDLKRAYLGR